MQIVRFAHLGTSLHSFDCLPPGVSQRNVYLTAQDGGESQGVLYTRTGREKTCVCFMHPRGDQSRHYAMPAMLEAGFAVFGQAGRWLMNDSDFEFEVIVADIAASQKWLREQGFERLIVVGNSGGGTLFAFYQHQACTPPGERWHDTAAGDPCMLPQLDMPKVDGMVHIATHLGQGRLMLDNIDPSVTDEHDPLSCDPSLDMYNPDNGFVVPPAPSRYSEAFLQRFRSAQLARVARIDALARARVEHTRAFRAELQAESFARRPLKERQYIERRALSGSYMQVHRTQANPAMLDPAITPNKRAVGSFYSERPDICNYLAAGFGKWQTPRAWLSCWSYLSTRAHTLKCLPRIDVPTLVLAFTGDNVIFPGELEQIHAQSPATDKAMLYVDGDHFGNLLPGQTHGGRAQACALVAGWLQERFL